MACGSPSPVKGQAFDLIDRSLEYLYKGWAGFSSSEKAGQVASVRAGAHQVHLFLDFPQGTQPNRPYF
jgi:hypothetical protein